MTDEQIEEMRLDRNQLRAALYQVLVEGRSTAAFRQKGHCMDTYFETSMAEYKRLRALAVGAVEPTGDLSDGALYWRQRAFIEMENAKKADERCGAVARLLRGIREKAAEIRDEAESIIDGAPLDEAEE